VFDGSRGRLWVICPRCDRWNLAPLGDRWEAIEELERLWTSVTARLDGEELSMGRLRSGMWVVRVGRRADDAEVAAWRWGRKRGRAGGLLRASAGLGVVALGTSLAVAQPMVALGAASFLVWATAIIESIDRSQRSVTTFAQSGDVTTIRRHEFLNAGMAPTDDELGWSIRMQRYLIHTERTPWLGISGMPLVERETGLAEHRWVEFNGADAVSIARRAFPMLNRRRIKQSIISDALYLIRDSGGPAEYLRSAADEKPHWVRFRHYPKAMKLALEIVLFQEEERRALEGELHRLESAWIEAENLAAISDGLIPPKGWDDFRRRHGPQERPTV